ncbi:MAG: YggS family pyridoxal phosphate-dependent enzyme [Fimbriimonadaceae bacterium]|nr:YggS family pyridoxal phosphate-dependent enzyme [Fimbriimonadaceae bacterium]
MTDSMISAAARLAALRARIAAAAARAGRSPDHVTLVAAVKTRTAAEVAPLLAAGLTELGHNYVQEAAAMRAALPTPAVWRLIGPLQRNKVGAALRCCDVVDSLDSPDLATALAARCERDGRATVDVLLQVRLGEESTKAGVAPAAVAALLAMVQQTPHLRCLGLMTMPPPPSVEPSRPHFARLRGLAEELRAASGLPLPVLSMGMSADYEDAILEGATHVRVGTALFGPRTPR